MKKTAVILCLLSALTCLGQTNNIIYAKQFPGSDVGSKVANAQKACAANPAMNCVIVLDSSLSTLPAGTMPTLAGKVHLADYRSGSSALAGVSSDGANGVVILGTVAAGAVNSIVSACSYSGATADIQITAALEAISSGGTVDARCYGASKIYIASQVHIAPGGTAGAPQKLIFDKATNVLPSTNTTNMFRVGPNGSIDGLRVTLPSTMSYAGKVITVDEGHATGNPNFSIDNINVDAWAEASHRQTGVALDFESASSAVALAYMHVNHVRCNGLQNCILLHTSADGWINSNYFSDIASVSSAGGVQMTADGTPSSGNTISGNQFVGYTYEMAAGTRGYAVVYSGVSTITYNTFAPASFVDTSSPIKNFNTLTNGVLGNIYTNSGSPSPDETSVAAGTAANGSAVVKNIVNASLLAAGSTTSGENLIGFGFGGLSGNIPYYQHGPAFGSYLKGYNQAGLRGYCMHGSNTSVLCAQLAPTSTGGDLTVYGAYNNSEGTVIPSTATGNTGSSTGKVSLVPGTEAFGYATLVSGTVRVSNAAACTPSATCVYKLTRCAANSSTAIGSLSVGTVTAGTSFIVDALSATNTIVTGDHSSVCWQIN